MVVVVRMERRRHHVRSTRGLVEQENARVRQKLGRDGGALALAARDAAAQDVADLGVHALFQAQHVDHVVHLLELVLFGHAARQPQERLARERLHAPGQDQSECHGRLGRIVPLLHAPCT